MHEGRTVLCVIPARGGSKGVPGKNIRPLAGKPLIVHSIEQALASRYIDRVVVSSDDAAIAEVARAAGAEAPFLRPAELATDGASTLDALLHTLSWLRQNEGYVPDALVLLHATGPLRSVDDVDMCIELAFEPGADNVFSVTEAYRNPYFNQVEVAPDGTVALVKPAQFAGRQTAPAVYDVNASIYVWRTDILERERAVVMPHSRLYVMPRERSVDIDDEVDFILAEALLARSRG